MSPSISDTARLPLARERLQRQRRDGVPGPKVTVAAETRLLKGGGRPHAFPSLGVVRAHGEEGPRVPTDLELGENRAPFVQETVMEPLLSASTQHRAGR